MNPQGARMAVERSADIGSAMPGGHDGDLVRRQQGKFLEGHLFVNRALETLEASHIREGTALVLGEQLVSWARVTDVASAVPILRLFARTFAEAVDLTQMDPDLLSLCVLVSGALVEEFEVRGMTEELSHMRQMFPQLNLPWCHALFQRESLARLPVAGAA
jgi:hypothetical protein